MLRCTWDTSGSGYPAAAGHSRKFICRVDAKRTYARRTARLFVDRKVQRLGRVGNINSGRMSGVRWPDSMWGFTVIKYIFISRYPRHSRIRRAVSKIKTRNKSKKKIKINIQRKKMFKWKRIDEEMKNERINRSKLHS